MALRNLLVRVGADSSGLTRGLNNARSEVRKFTDAITGAMDGVKGKIAGALALIGGGEFLKQGIDDAQAYEAAMATLGGTFGKSTQQFLDWASTTGRAMGYSKLQSAQLAQTLSLNFRSIATSQEDLVAKTTKMEEVAALISNKRGMAMTEVSDRIRSAMNQEADGADELGVNVRVSALQQSEAYKQMANGKPWQQLNTNQQKTILYNSILEQVTATLGNTMQDTTAFRMAQFTASLGDVRLALGQAFLPVLYVVLPILTTLMNWLEKALEVFAAFMTALFGGFKFGGGNPIQVGGINATTDATNKQAQAVNNLGKAHEATGKKAKAAGKAAQQAAKLGVAAFDEVNTLNFPTAKAAGAGAGGAGVGGAGGAGVPAVPTIPTPQLPSPDLSQWNAGVNAMVDKFKKTVEPIRAIAKEVWSAVSSFVMSVATQISEWWKKNGTEISDSWSKLWKILEPVIKWFVGFVWDSIQGLIKGLVKFFEGLTEFLTGIFSGDWGKVWQGLIDMIVGAFLVFWNWTNLTFIGGIKKMFVDLAADGLKTVMKWILDMRTNFEDFMAKIFAGFVSTVNTIKSWIFDFGNWFISNSISIALNVIKAFEKIGDVGKTIWQAIKNAFSDAVNWFSRSIITPLINNFDNIKNGFNRGIGAGLTAVVNSIRGPLNDMIGAFNGAASMMHIPISIRPIPQLAQGGIAMGPTLALVGEGRGPEAIAPLDKLQGFITTAVAQTIQQMGGGSARGDIILNIDGRRFARIVQPYLNNESKRIGTNVRLNTI